MDQIIEEPKECCTGTSQDGQGCCLGSKDHDKCGGCGVELQFADQTYSYKGGRWHYQCMRIQQTKESREKQKMAELKDSGKREQFSTGAVRDVREGKGRYDLISPIFLEQLAHHVEAGAKKYADRNWEKGITLGRTLDSCLRHLNQWRGGDRSENHLIAAACNIMFLIHHIHEIEAGRLPQELDDNHYIGVNKS